MTLFLEFAGQHLMDKKVLKAALGHLLFSYKGLSSPELQYLSGASEDECRALTTLFRPFLANCEGRQFIYHQTFQTAVTAYCFSNLEEESVELHRQQAQVIELITDNSIAKLERLTFHLHSSREFFRLKEIISNIENFLLFYNPFTKYDLCKYWQCLEERGFDPVIGYNKSVEEFDMHFRPKTEELFRIIVQVSRFLREFADFETAYTPSFRHPPIKGKQEELEHISLFQEIQSLGLFYDEKSLVMDIQQKIALQLVARYQTVQEDV